MTCMTDQLRIDLTVSSLYFIKTAANVSRLYAASELDTGDKVVPNIRRRHDSTGVARAAAITALYCLLFDTLNLLLFQLSLLCMCMPQVLCTFIFTQGFHS